MDSTRLLTLFREQVMDTERPYLWSDNEVWAYMNDAYAMFVRLTGGVPDFTSDICRITAAAGETTSEVSPAILRFMSARRATDGREIDILNSTDLGRMHASDYGETRPFRLTDDTGPVRAMVIGMQRHLVRWINVPEQTQDIDLEVYRLPLGEITGPGQQFDDIDPQHHIHLLKWMKALAYRKDDAETFDRGRAEENETLFIAYCDAVSSEMERYQHKTRMVVYGGL